MICILFTFIWIKVNKNFFTKYRQNEHFHTGHGSYSARNVLYYFACEDAKILIPSWYKHSFISWKKKFKTSSRSPKQSLKSLRQCRKDGLILNSCSMEEDWPTKFQKRTPSLLIKKFCKKSDELLEKIAKKTAHQCCF